MADETNKSEEELEEEKSESESSEEEQEEKESEEESQEESKEEEESEKEEESPTVPLSDHTRTKDILYRMTEEIVKDEDKLAELAESDPKRLERLKGEFPKLFKDVKIPARQMSDEDFEEKVKAEVAKQLKGSGKSEVLTSLQKELGMTDMEFLDIKDDISREADRILRIELADNTKDAVMLAYRNLNPKKYKELVQKQVAKDLKDRKENSKSGAGSSGESKKFSKTVLDNYQRLGFKTPEEMVKYQQKDSVISIADHVKGTN
jgi:hypothetical protein